MKRNLTPTLRRGLSIMVIAALLAALALNSSHVAHAAITVTNTNDSGAGSLRQAIADASPGDTINFNLTYPATIILTSGHLTVDKSLTISGPGANQLTISGNDARRVFWVNTTGSVSLSDLTVRDGYARGGNGGEGWRSGGGGAGLGGGLFVNNGTVTLTSATPWMPVRLVDLAMLVSSSFSLATSNMLLDR